MPIKIPNYGQTSTQRRKRITIQSNTPTRDAYGAAVDDWTDVLAVWTVNWQTLSGREYFLGEQVQGEADSIITIRYIPSLQIKPEAYRLKLEAVGGCRHFTINAAINVGEQGQYLKLVCKEATE